jgi:hypothetical protein
LPLHKRDSAPTPISAGAQPGGNAQGEQLLENGTTPYLLGKQRRPPNETQSHSGQELAPSMANPNMASMFSGGTLV